MIDNEDTVQAIRHLTENFGESAEEYPLIITRPEFKRFKVIIHNYVSLWNRFNPFGQCSQFVPLEDNRKLLVFRCFQGV